MDTYANFFDKHNKKIVETPVAIQGAQKGHFKWDFLEFLFWKPSTVHIGHGGHAYG